MRDRLERTDELAELLTLARIGRGHLHGLERETRQRGRNEYLPLLESLSECLSSGVVGGEHRMLCTAELQLRNGRRSETGLALAFVFGNCDQNNLVASTCNDCFS